MIERSDGHRIVDYVHELVAKFILNVLAEDAFAYEIEISVVFVPMA